ncbi:VOC family protein [Parapedobacter koreensis]|uniref:hypothetical protein n=1 Tax=Parapedobacter koreensis TaxID=332977 RepID=UPI000B833666|nr:hypothetical protein [Parapedobacter koreensis]
MGATVVSQYEIAEGKIAAKVAIEGAEFYIGDEEPQFGNVFPHLDSGCSVRIILTTRDADKIFENALKSGAKQI